MSENTTRIPWEMAADKSHWTAAMPDGRPASIVRVLDAGGTGSILFVPRVGDAVGPACIGVLGAAAWCAELAGQGAL